MKETKTNSVTTSDSNSQGIARTDGHLGTFEIWMNPVSANTLMRKRDGGRNYLLRDWRQQVAIHHRLEEFAIPKDGPWPITVRYTQLLGRGSRELDDDNRFGMAKLIGDAFKDLGLVPDDKRKYVRTEYGDPIAMRDKPCGGVRVEIFAPREQVSLDACVDELAFRIKRRVDQAWEKLAQERGLPALIADWTGLEAMMAVVIADVYDGDCSESKYLAEAREIVLQKK